MFTVVLLNKRNKGLTKECYIMKTKIAVMLKNIFMYTTLIWSSVMLVVYLIVLFEIPLFAWISYLPLGEEFCRLLEFMIFFGIWIVPVLYIITISFMIFVRKKLKEGSQNKRISISVIILPLCLAALMLATNFIELLA